MLKNNFTFYCKDMHITKLSMNYFREVEAVLNCNKQITFKVDLKYDNKEEFMYYFILLSINDPISIQSDISSSIIVDRNNILNVFSNGSIQDYRQDFKFYYNNKTPQGYFQPYDIGIPFFIEEVTWTSIPDCMTISDGKANIQPGTQISARTNLTYSINSSYCSQNQTLTLYTSEPKFYSDKTMYNIILEAEFPPIYTKTEVEAYSSNGYIDIFAKYPLDEKISTIIFKQLTLGQILFKMNNQTEYAEVDKDKEYDSKFKFYFSAGKNLNENTTVIVPFILKDKFGVF